MLRLNLRFRAAIKFHTKPISLLADLAGVNRQDLYDLANEKRMPVENDQTVLKVAELLGFSADACFIEDLPEPEDIA